MTGLTPKQEKFCQCVAEGMTQADAYRAAYDCKPTTKAETIINKASALMKRGDIRATVESMRGPIREKAGITLETHLNDLLELRNRARDEGQYSAAISAEIARAKAAGVSIEKSEVTQNVRQLPPLSDDEFLG